MMCYSYAMGMNDDILSLRRQGFAVERDGANFTLAFAAEKAADWEKFVSRHLRLSNTIRTRLSGRLMRPAFLSFIDGRQPICFIQDPLNTSSIPLRSQISEPRGRPETRRRFADGPSPGGKR